MNRYLVYTKKNLNEISERKLGKRKELTLWVQKWHSNICTYLNPPYAHKQYSNEHRFCITFPATDTASIVQNFPHQMILEQVGEVNGAEEEEQKAAATEAEVVEMGALGVAFQAEEVVEMIMVVELSVLKTFGQIAVLEFPVFVQVESQKQE